MLATDEDVRAAEREQWDDGNNFLAVSPGVVVGYERNVATNTMLRSTASRSSPSPAASSAAAAAAAVHDLPDRTGPRLGRGDDDNRAVGVVQHGVPDRAGPCGPECVGVPADDHQVGPGRQADQRPARMAVYDLLADRDVGVLWRQVISSASAAGRRPPRRCAGGGYLAGPEDLGLRRVPGVDGYQAGLAQARLLERERQRVTAVVQVTDAHADQPGGPGSGPRTTATGQDAWLAT